MTLKLQCLQWTNTMHMLRTVSVSDYVKYPVSLLKSANLEEWKQENRIAESKLSWNAFMF